jgi:DNA sulfur modification protein DndE
MPVQNIQMKNMVIRSKHGIDIQEAENIQIKNLELYTEKNNPVVDIIQSRKIEINGLKFPSKAELLLRVSGERSSDIRLIDTETGRAKKAVLTELGAKPESIRVDAPPTK